MFKLDSCFNLIRVFEVGRNQLESLFSTDAIDDHKWCRFAFNLELDYLVVASYTCDGEIGAPSVMYACDSLDAALDYVDRLWECFVHTKIGLIPEIMHIAGSDDDVWQSWERRVALSRSDRYYYAAHHYYGRLH